MSTFTESTCNAVDRYESLAYFKQIRLRLQLNYVLAFPCFFFFPVHCVGPPAAAL